MDNSYADFIICKYSKFLDPFSLTEISTERICYPVSYATEDMFRGWNGAKVDFEDDLLIRQTLLRDLPEFEKSNLPQTFITDGAAHILRNRMRENFIQLLGMPKIGKSTLLKKLALLAAQDMKQDPSSPAPLLINLESISKLEICSKMELIEACFSQYEEFEAYLREKFFEGRIILLLDELDSVPSMLPKLYDWLLALKTYIKLPLCVICGRHSSYQELENSTVLYIDIYPLKLQISMAQNMLSELQFERFVELITGPSGHFCEFSSTPFLFSLLLEMFRWGVVGTESSERRGTLFSLACKQLLTGESVQRMQCFEVLANDLLMRNTKWFGYIDVKNCGLEMMWNEIQNSQIVMIAGVKSIEANDVSGEDSENSGVYDRESSNIKQVPRRDTTPQWVSNSKEAYFNYQIARKCLVEFNKGKNDQYRFVHLRITEVLAAHSYINAIEDSLLHASAGFLMESSAYQRTFNTCFPINFFYCKRFREVLMFISSLASENIFENLVKYLLSRETYECCIIGEKILKERGIVLSYRPLVNKIKQDRLEYSKKYIAKGFAHPSSAVQKITREEALESGMSEQEILTVINKNIDFILKTSHWTLIKHLSLPDSDQKILKALFSKLLETSSEIVSNITKPAPFKIMVYKILVSLFVSRFEKKENSVQTSSNYTPPVSSCSTPNKSENPNNTEESTFKISFDKFKFCKNDSSFIEKLPNVGKLMALVIDLLQICPAIDVILCVKLLIILNCSMGQIHTSLSARFACLEDCYERKEVLRVLRLLGFVTQHTVDLPLISLTLDKELFFLAKDIIKLLISEKLKKHALNALAKEDTPNIKILLSIRALSFINKQELDNEVFYFLVQFIDHYTLELRLEAIKSLYLLVKDIKIIDKNEIRKTLAVVPHVLKDRIRLPKYDSKLKSWSVKCLTALWACLDKGKEDSYSTQMFHILVKEQLGTSFLVGSFTNILSIVKDCFLKSNDEKQAAWICLRKISPILDYLEATDRSFIFTQIEQGMNSSDPNEVKSILKLLLSNNLSFQDRSRFLSSALSIQFHIHPFLTRYLAALILKNHEIGLIKTIVPSTLTVSKEFAELLTKLKNLIESLYEQIESYGNESLNELKHLHNYYKSLINQIAENLQWPSKVFPHCNQLLDISADPSFFREDIAPEISASFADLDISIAKYSADSIHTELEENPPAIQICYQLILAGIRSEGLKYWVLWYLKRAEKISELVIAGESWRILSNNKDFYNPHVENLLSKFLTQFPEEVLKIVLEIQFKSDSFCVKILNGIMRGEIKTENAARAVIMCMEMNSPLPLEESYKLVGANSNDSVHMFYLHDTGVKILEAAQIASDCQMNSVLKAMVSTGCSLFVQCVWKYWMKVLRQRPGYLLSVHAVNVLENCNSWDCKFLLTRARIIGLIPVEQFVKETGSSMSTKKL